MCRRSQRRIKDKVLSIGIFFNLEYSEHVMDSNISASIDLSPPTGSAVISIFA
jgi:hypothetical protein